MKAVIWNEYGPPESLVIGEIDKPSPADNEILVKIQSVSVNAGDCETRGLRLPGIMAFALRLFIGLKKPKRIKILGQDYAGEVETMGKGVTGFNLGDRVFGTTDIGLGTYAEYICLRQGADNHLIEKMPDSLKYTEASAIPVSGLEALYFLKKAKIEKDESILIIGAGGSIGTHAIQLAKHFKAHVTAVDRGEKQEMIESLGVDYFIDYQSEDYSSKEIRYDVIFDVTGKSKMLKILKTLNPNGRFLDLNPTFSKFAAKLFIGLAGNKKIIIGGAKRESKELIYLRDLVDKGILKPIIDKTYSLDEIAAAHRYAESGLKKGHVTIKVLK